jgi:lipoyl(octanoyl) transferase
MLSPSDALLHPSTYAWRFIKSSASSAAWNMALDEAILTTTVQKKSLPTLRLYSWEVPSLSLGYAQTSEDVDVIELSKRNWQLVRRPTGGRAILHTDEITYCITAPLDDPLVTGSLLESYQRISIVLQKSLLLLGANTFANNKSDTLSDQSRKDPVCFQTPSKFEITWNGKKLIGSAQARKLGGVLQHGSLPLFGDLSRITQVLAYASQTERESDAQKTLAQATTLEQAVDKIITWDEAASAFISSFTSEFGISFTTDQPTQEEIEIANHLVESKYGLDSWTLRI